MSPFKLLQAYEEEDASIFFGREQEILQVADLLRRGKFLLLYGSSGTGKTSLIQCGLPGMLSPRDWLPIWIRRGDHWVKSIKAQIEAKYEEYAKLGFNSAGSIQGESLRDSIKKLFQISRIPIYLILDQFEELFTLGNAEEQKVFFQELKDLRLFDADLFCKIIMVSREEYLGHLYPFEQEHPFLFQYRYRLEHIREQQLLQAVQGIIHADYAGFPKIKAEPEVVKQIIKNLKDERGEVDLATLQVYLDKLYREKWKPGLNVVVFGRALLAKHKIGDVLEQFLLEQVGKVDQQIAPDGNAQVAGSKTLDVLYKLVTSQGTRQHKNEAEILKELQLGNSAITDHKSLLVYLDALCSPSIHLVNKIQFIKGQVLRYELVHDRIAAQVYRKFNTRETMQREAVALIDVKNNRYAETKEYLSRGELEFIRNAINVGQLAANLKVFYENSRKNAQRKEYFQRGVAVFSSIAAVVFLILSISNYKQKILIESKNEDIKSKNKTLISKNNKIKSQKDSIIDKNKAIFQTNTKLARQIKRNIQFLLGEAQRNMLILDYDNAYNLLLEAEKFGIEKEVIASVMVEPAFYYIYTGNLSKAWIVIQKIAGLTSNGSVTQRKLTRAHLLSQLKGLNAKELKSMENKYFPKLIPVQGGIYTRILMDKGGNPIDTEEDTIPSFRIAETEVTIWQYNLFDPKHKEKILIGPKEGDYPCSFISWNDAIRYCNWLSIQRGFAPVYKLKVDGDDLLNVEMVGKTGYRLPYACEWEWAAYGGKVGYQKGLTVYAGKGALDKVGWHTNYKDGNRLHKPKGKNPNSIKIYDMSGNLAEWCWDGVDQGTKRILKGGAFSDLENNCKILHNDESFYITFGHSSTGLRLVEK